MTAPATTKLTHPDSKQTIETREPEAYLSQGWVEKASSAAKKDD